MIKKNELTHTAFATLLLVGLVMGANHVAARVAFNHGLDVATAVTVRSGVTAIVVTLLILIQQVPVRLTRQHIQILPVIGILMAIQSVSIYSSVVRLPVSLALLAFNTYPLWIALWARVLYGHHPEPQVLRAMPVLLIGLALALDVFGATSGLGVKGQWSEIGVGVAFALTAAATFGLAMVLTQHKAADLDGRVRTAATMWMIGMLALIGTKLTGDFHWPHAAAGWWGLAALSVLYGTGFTIMFTVLPRLGVVGNSAIMNVEPIFALILAWLILGQSIAWIQVLGACIVVATVIKIGLRKQSS
ncbi:MAG: DMT family transporter [Sheuella sp.]|nr:DMT family transporter [Sheuella sp.]